MQIGPILSPVGPLIAVNHAKYNASSSPLFKHTGILKLYDIYQMRVGQFMHKLFFQNAPQPLQGIVVRNLDIHDRNTRQRNDFVIRLYRNTVVYNSFLCQGPKLWNSLPQVIKVLRYNRFVKKLKTDYLEKY